jgi:formylglycine-generating enzyme
MRIRPLLLLLVCLSPGHPVWAVSELVAIPDGSYVPFFLQSNQKADQDQFKKTPVKVEAFLMDKNLVTNGDFLEFVKSNPEWRRSKIKHLFSDNHYLRHWRSDLTLTSPTDKNRPATNISWFAARAYCESRDMDLPTTDQWEFVFFDEGRNREALKEKALSWYGQPTAQRLAKVGSEGKNDFGVYDLSSIVWEWTLDFNSFVINDAKLSCGGGSLGAFDSADYVAFMRYSFRTSLKANYTTGNLGFRCVKEKGIL